MTSRAALATYAWTFLVPFCLLGAFGFVVDPSSVFNFPIIEGVNQAKIYEPPQQNAVYRAVWKTVEIIRDKPSRIILGSSTADGGFDMTDPFYAPLIGSADPIYNAAIRGGNLETVEHYLYHTYANNPHLKEVFLSLDWLFFSEHNPPCCRSVLEPSILGQTFISPSFVAEQLWSWSTLRDSFIVLNDSDDYAITDWAARRWTVWRKWSSKRFPNLASPPPPSASQPSPFTARTGPEIQRFVALEQWAREWSTRPPSAYLVEDAFRSFRRIVDFCNAHSIALDVFLTPTEETWWAATKRSGVWPVYLEFLRRLAAIHPFWDFAPLIDTDAAKADIYFGGDLWHYQNAAGRIIMSHILDGTQAGKRDGLYVTASSVEGHIEQRQQLLEQWISENPYQMDFVNNIPLGRHLLGSDLSAKLLDEDYHGYWLVQQADHFYAFPGRPRSVDIVAVKAKSVPGMIEGDSLDGIKAGVSTTLQSGRPPEKIMQPNAATLQNSQTP